MSSVDQGSEINEYITFKRKPNIALHVIYIPFTNIDFCYEIINKRSLNCVI